MSKLRRQQKELSVLKQHASSVARAQKDIEGLESDVAALETELTATGSTRTADDVQQEIAKLSSEMFVCLCMALWSLLTSDISHALDREKSNLTTERDRSLTSQRIIESELHRQQLQESNLQNQMKDRDLLEMRISSNRTRLTELNTRAKVCYFSRFVFTVFTFDPPLPQRNLMLNLRQPMHPSKPWKRNTGYSSLISI